MILVHAVFFLSGFAAFIYQVVWQRALFALYGINVESVTVVVTAFMLGLGLGALAGGALSRDARRPAILAFAVFELGVGLFGAFSLQIIHVVGAATLLASPAGIALVTLLLLLAPTMLMGATLPVLAGWSTRLSGNVGRAVGHLYFVNTLGSALASALCVLVLLGTLGQQGSVRLAAGCNLLAAALALVAARRAAHADAKSSP